MNYFIEAQEVLESVVSTVEAFEELKESCQGEQSQLEQTELSENQTLSERPNLPGPGRGRHRSRGQLKAKLKKGIKIAISAIKFLNDAIESVIDLIGFAYMSWELISLILNLFK